MDPIPYLQIFVERFQVGILVADNSAIRKRTVEVYLQDMDQIFSGVGSSYPRLNHQGFIDFILGKQLKAYSFPDPPSTRV